MLGGGINFELYVQVELTAEESGLVSKYRADTEQLLNKASAWGVQILTIGSLIKGQKFKGANISEILEYEEAVKEACKNFKRYLVAMRSFGGTETFEY